MQGGMAVEKEQTAAGRLLKRVRGLRYSLVLEGILVGAASGLTAVLFRLALEQAEAFRQWVGQQLSQTPWAIPLWVVALLVGAALVTLLLKWEPYIGGSGIPQVEGELQGALSQCWWRVLTAKFLGGVISIGAGLSLGREGPSIQLGAMAGKGVSRLCRRECTEERLLFTCGAGAGLSAAFNAPLAGVLFALEELHKDFSTQVLLSMMSASITADLVSRVLCGQAPVFDFTGVEMLPLSQYWMVLILGLFLGVVGAFYNFCLEKSQQLYAKLPWQYLRTVIPFLLAGVLLLVYPKVLGGGSSLVGQVSQSMALEALLLLFAVKFLYSMVSFGSGVPGGIFLPLLVLGALVGACSSQVFQLMGFSVPTENFIMLAMAGMFSAIVRAPVTGIVLISEMCGSVSHLLTLTLVSLAAYVVADLLGSRPVYEMLLDRLLHKGGHKPKAAPGKLLLEATVCHGALASGKAVRELSWPEGMLLVAVRRGEQELVPQGTTVLKAGDVVALLCDPENGPEAHRTLECLCKETLSNPQEM